MTFSFRAQWSGGHKARKMSDRGSLAFRFVRGDGEVRWALRCPLGYCCSSLTTEESQGTGPAPLHLPRHPYHPCWSSKRRRGGGDSLLGKVRVWAGPEDQTGVGREKARVTVTRLQRRGKPSVGLVLVCGQCHNSPHNTEPVCTIHPKACWDSGRLTGVRCE